MQYLRPGVLVSPACEPASQLTLPWLFDTCAWVCQCEELRKFQEQVKNKITAKYGKHSFSSAFKWIDADRTGSITREEFKQAMRDFNLSGVRENILDTLCDFIDQDGSGSCVQPANERARRFIMRLTCVHARRVVGFREFAQVLSADDVMQWAPSNKEKAMADLVKHGC